MSKKSDTPYITVYDDSGQPYKADLVSGEQYRTLEKQLSMIQQQLDEKSKRVCELTKEVNSAWVEIGDLQGKLDEERKDSVTLKGITTAISDPGQFTPRRMGEHYAEPTTHWSARAVFMVIAARNQAKGTA